MVLNVPTIELVGGGNLGREVAYPSTGGDTLSRWFVIHTKSRQEKALAESLEALGVEYFLPLTTQVRYYGRRKVQAALPLFPGYLFLNGTREQAFSADRTKRVAQIITVADQQRLCMEMAQIRRVLEGGGNLEPFAFLKRGVRVEVIAGPWRGLRGVIEDRVKRNRLILQVDVLGQATSLEIDGSLLEPVEDLQPGLVTVGV